MSTRDVAIEKNRYLDSVFLMAMARRMSEQPGIEDAAAVMGSAANQLVLIKMGFDEETLKDVGPSDLIVALSGDPEVVNGILTDIESWLVRPKFILDGAMALSLEDALQQQATSNLAVISLPGEHAASVAHEALDRGMNVFLFSDHVSLEDELSLKSKASDAGLIVMGPDCGTAIIAGKGIGFANVVRRGTIGVVASSGTGLQEFTSLVHRSGAGISYGFGTGGRDLSDAVGGISTLTAIAALDSDPETEVIAVVSKPPGQATLEQVVQRLNRCSKPVVACFLGLDEVNQPPAALFEISATLDDVVAAALQEAGQGPDGLTLVSPREIASQLEKEAAKLQSEQQYIRGLFAGGTFCYQAQQVMRDGGVDVHSNAPLAGMILLDDENTSVENTLVDMGSDEFTAGVPHPMIDATNRRARILAEADDPTVAVLLLDFVLGFNASSDPAGDLVEAIVAAKNTATAAGRYLSVVASMCGTDEDPQGLDKQEQLLRDAGVILFPSNAQASQFARDVLRRQMEGSN
jgi:FdrA protein